MSTEDTFLTRDGTRLARRSWLPTSTPRVLVVLLHGYADHCGRYRHLGVHLNAHGAAVHSYDHRGHGRSEGRRAYVRSFDAYVEDLSFFIQFVRSEHNDLPLYLFGHSMGAAIALLYALQQPPGLSGLILSSPSVRVGENQFPLLQKFAGFLGKTVPFLPTIKVDRTLISKDPAVVSEAQQDPLNFHGGMPARTGAEILKASRQIRSTMHQLTVPMLIIHGTDDQLTEPQGSVELYETAASEDKTLALFPGLSHETFNEPEKRRVLLEISGWINEHTE